MRALRLAKYAGAAFGSVTAAVVAARESSCSEAFPPSSDKENTKPPRAARPVFQPCPEVACKSKEELAAMFSDESMPPVVTRVRRSKATTTKDDGPAGSGKSSESSKAAGASGAVLAASAAATQLPCPPVREEIGRSTWTLLHALAAYYPAHPSGEEQRAALGLVHALRHLFPCTHCRAQLQIDLERLPPQVGSRRELSLWVCQQHNLVNELLGKPAFPCSLEALDERWRTGRRECWLPSEQTASESLGQVEEGE